MDSYIGNFDKENDGATGNLLSRTHNDGPTETFAYDDLDRLVSVKRGGAEPVEMYYEDNGNIAYKTAEVSTRLVDSANGFTSRCSKLILYIISRNHRNSWKRTSARPDDTRCLMSA